MRAPQDRRHKIFRFRRSTTTTSLLHKEELCSGGAVINALGADCYCNRIDQSGALQTLHLHCFLQILFFFCKKNVHGDIYFAWPVALVEFHVKGLDGAAKTFHLNLGPRTHVISLPFLCIYIIAKLLRFSPVKSHHQLTLSARS